MFPFRRNLAICFKGFAWLLVFTVAYIAYKSFTGKEVLRVFQREGSIPSATQTNYTTTPYLVAPVSQLNSQPLSNAAMTTAPTQDGVMSDLLSTTFSQSSGLSSFSIDNSDPWTSVASSSDPSSTVLSTQSSLNTISSPTFSYQSSLSDPSLSVVPSPTSSDVFSSYQSSPFDPSLSVVTSPTSSDVFSFYQSSPFDPSLSVVSSPTSPDVFSSYQSPPSDPSLSVVSSPTSPDVFSSYQSSPFDPSLSVVSSPTSPDVFSSYQSSPFDPSLSVVPSPTSPDAFPSYQSSSADLFSALSLSSDAGNSEFSTVLTWTPDLSSNSILKSTIQASPTNISTVIVSTFDYSFSSHSSFGNTVLASLSSSSLLSSSNVLTTALSSLSHNSYEQSIFDTTPVSSFGDSIVVTSLTSSFESKSGIVSSSSAWTESMPTQVSLTSTEKARPEKSSSSGLSTGGKVALGILIPVGIIGLTVLFVFFYRRYNLSHRSFKDFLHTSVRYRTYANDTYNEDESRLVISN